MDESDTGSCPPAKAQYHAPIVRHTLRLIAQVHRTAGAEGGVKVFLPDSEYDSQDPVLSLEAIESLTHKGCLRLVDGDTFGNPLDSHGSATGHFLFLFYELSAAAADQSADRRKSEADLTRLREHARFLENIGLYALLDEGQGIEDGDAEALARAPTLLVAAVFARALCDSNNSERHPVKSALRDLISLSQMQCDEVALFLRRPVFGQPAPEAAAQLRTVDPDALIAVADQWKACGGSHDLFVNMAAARRVRNPEPRVNFIVPGLIPMAAVTLFAGSGSLGKSTMMQELATAAGTPVEPGSTSTWLGIQLTSETDVGLVVMISGEDGDDIVDARQKVLDPDGRATLLAIKVCNKSDLRRLMADLRTVPNLRLVIIDPTRKFMDGDEQGSEHASEFFDQLESLASATGCAVVATHHFVKGANPRSKEDVRRVIRGSGVFSDRPRVVIGGYRTETHTCLMVAKHNIPPGNGVPEEPLYLVRDPQTLRHLPAEAPAKKKAAAAGKAPEVPKVSEATTVPFSAPDAAPSDLKDTCLKELVRLTEAGRVVNRTGKKSLFGWRPAELAGQSRKKVDGCVQALIESGAIVLCDCRLTPAAPTTQEPVPAANAA